jgi:hypothetical protein
MTIDPIGYIRTRPAFCMDFWSPSQEAVVIPAAAADQALPSVVVSGIPAEAVLIRVVAMFKFRAIRETSAGANALAGAQDIQVDDSVATGWLDAINFVDNQFTLAASAEEGSDTFIGDEDIKARVDGDDTYSFQWDEAVADAASIEFNDVQVGLRIWWR